MVTLESATAKRLLITSGTRCLHKKLWSPILLIGFPDTSFLTFLEMPFAVWLVSDFVSTPFALKQQLNIPPLPLLATCVKLMDDDVQDEKHAFFHARTLRWFLSAGSTRIIFTDRIRMCLLFCTRKTRNFIFSIINLFYFMNRRAVILLV